jgi:hypothetical protein
MPCIDLVPHQLQSTHSANCIVAAVTNCCCSCNNSRVIQSKRTRFEQGVVLNDVPRLFLQVEAGST